jgi:hypothetical protein
MNKDLNITSAYRNNSNAMLRDGTYSLALIFSDKAIAKKVHSQNLLK